MRLKRLQVENIRSYKNLDISFDSGVTVVSGVNGSGKSSLLEACFSGLFGSSTLPAGFVIADMIHKGETKASISLEFEQGGREYVVEQGYRVNPKTGSASSSGSVLKVDGKILVDQATQTYDAVRELLNMDEEAYKNCVYIRQGEIDVLINAKPKDRQRMIDDLLQLGRLEEYRERAGSARVGVGRIKRDVEWQVKNILTDIEKIEIEKPHDKLNKSREMSGRVQSNIDALGKKKDAAKSKMDELNTTISEYSALSVTKDSINSQITEFNGKKTTAFKEIESIRNDILLKNKTTQKIKEETSVLKKEIEFEDGGGGGDIKTVVEDMDADERRTRDNVSAIENKRKLLENSMAQKRESVKDQDNQLSAIQKTIKKLNDDLASMQQGIERSEGSLKEFDGKRQAAVDEVGKLGFTIEKLDNIDDMMELLTDQQKKLHGREREKSTEIAELNKRIEKSKDLLAKGMCPTCGQDLKGSSIGETTAGDEEQKLKFDDELSGVRSKQVEIDEKLGRVRSLKAHAKVIADCIKDMELIRSKVETSEKSIVDYNTRIAEEEKKVGELEGRREVFVLAIDEISKEIAELRERENVAKDEHSKAGKSLSVAKNIQGNILEIDKLQDNVKQLDGKIVDIQKMIGLFESQINERKERLVEVEKKMGTIDIKDLKVKCEQFESAHKNIGVQMESLSREKGEVQKDIGRLENEIRRLFSLENNLKLLKNKSDYLHAVYMDAEALENMYMRIRADLRSRNIGALDAALNEMFSFMYSNNAYSHIKLDSEYNLTVYEKDGTTLEPKLLSGGERAIFNLVLRCAIYRLLSLGVGGASRGAALPPLILDEPTVFLDRGHIQQLIKLIDMMRDIGVGQILIVSHDESLIDSADHVFVVEKDPITNTSSISAM
ncbi:MAG: AAA family ATPase [Methanosarcinaceae archaeon]|nr:AAA family ATPase [Methanosarcinaceae archaeon]